MKPTTSCTKWLPAAALALALPAFSQDPTLPEDANRDPSPPATSGQAAQLVQAMRLDELSAELLRRSAREPAQAGLTTAQVDCAQAVKPSAFTAGLADIIAQQLTREEVATSIDFFRSPTGRKTIDATFANLGVAPVAGTRNLTPDTDDTEITREFELTTAGQKVMGTHFFTRTQQSTDLIRETLNETVAACQPGS